MERRTFVKWASTALAGMPLRTRRILSFPKEASASRLVDLLPAPVPGVFGRTLSPGLGLSFSHSRLSSDQTTYQGVVEFNNADTMSRMELLQEEDDKSDDGHRVRRLKLEDREKGLRVTLEYTLFPEHHAIVYGGMLENGGPRNIDHLTKLLSFDLVFKPLQKIGDPLIHTSKGADWFEYYPPASYMLEKVRLFGPGDLSLDSGSIGGIERGRSTNEELPYFLVEDGEGSSGIFGGIEWSGSWHLTFMRRDLPEVEHYGAWGPDKSFAIQGGMTGVDLTLETGEKFNLPRVLLGFYEGGLDVGRNALRHFLSDWAPPFPKGTPDPHVQATPGGCFTSREATIDKNVRPNAAACAEIGVEYYCIEQWYPWYPYPSDDPATSKMKGFVRGSWVPDVVRFPDLKDLADYVRSLGMQFGLWLDIEVAREGSIVARQHPDWVLYLPGREDGLLNLGLPQVQRWVTATYDRLIRDYGLKWIFCDNNIDPGPYWEANEVPSRRGWLQHDHVRGLWAVREALLERHPDVLIENNPRRMDLGMFKRSHFHVQSEQFWYPDAIRYQLSGADWWLPANRMKTIVVYPVTPSSDLVFHCHFGGLLSITENVESWTPEEKQKAKRHIEVYKSIRHLLSKDFYPLFPQPQTMEEWDGWQFHDPQTGEGFILAFRAESPQENTTPRLKALKASARYVLKDPYSGKEEVVEGRRLLEEGFPVRVPLQGTALRTSHPQ